MKPQFKPFQPGTIRGPYTCGTGDGPNTGVQFLVKDKNHAWHPFIEKGRHNEAICRAKAAAFAKTI